MKGSFLTYIFVLNAALISCTSSRSLDPPNESDTFDLLKMNSKGLEVLKKAHKAHGNIKDSTLVVSVSVYTSEGVHRGQSLFADSPYETYHLGNKFMIDRINKREVAHIKNNFAGFNFENITIIDETAARNYDFMTNKYHEAKSSGFSNFRYFPHTYIESALLSPKSVLFLGSAIINDRYLDVVSVGSNDAMKKMYFDQQSGYLCQIETLVNYPPYGDGFSVKKFSEFEKHGALVFPTQVYSGGTYGAWGHAGNIFSVEVTEGTINAPTHDNMSEYIKADYSDTSMNQLTSPEEGIYIIENVTESTAGGDYNILFAEFESFILVGEAPVNNLTSRKVLGHIRATSNKPIQYLVQSHHHNDHWGGIREYIAEGTTIVTTESNRTLLEKIAHAPFELSPDSQWKNPKDLSMKLVQDSLIISDIENHAIVYDIGPTNHAHEMLIVYFPKQKMLWQADLVKYDEWDLNDPRTIHLVRKIEELNLKVDLIAGVHGKSLKYSKLKEYLKIEN